MIRSILSILKDWIGKIEICLVRANLAAGFGDNLSFGLTSVIRDATGANNSIDKCSGLYSAGEWAGTALGLAFGAAHLGRNALYQTGARRPHAGYTSTKLVLFLGGVAGASFIVWGYGWPVRLCLGLAGFFTLVFLVELVTGGQG
jgi:hypothetical protein